MANPPRSFLVIALRRIGDVLLTTPLIHSIRTAHPDAHVAALVFKGTGGVLAGNPDLDRVIEVPNRLSFGGYLRFLREHGRRYDWAISTQTGDRPTLLAFFAGRRSIAHLTGDPGKDWLRRLLLSRWPAAPERPRHMVMSSLALGEAIGIPSVPRQVAPSPQDFDLEAALGFDPRSQVFVVCHPMPMYRYKQWEEPYWQQLIERLLQRGCRVVISGGPGEAERAAIDRLLGELAGRVTDLSGRLSLAELAEVIRHAAGYCGTDTSVTHIAAATGTPVVALFGPTDPRIWGPWPASGASGGVNPWSARGPLQRCGNVTILQGHLDCVPCQLEGCDRHIHSASRCLEQIGVDQVIDAMPACDRPA